MPSWERINAPQLPTLPVFAHAAIAGDHVYVSGMLGVTDDFSGVVEGGIGAETTQALRHVETILRACGASLAEVAKVSVYMTDLEEWPAMNDAYVEALGSHTPARIAIGCASLLFGAKVELDCVAYRPRRRLPPACRARRGPTPRRARSALPGRAGARRSARSRGRSG